MPQILVNGADQTTDFACQRWGDLLERLDRRATREGHVLTAIRFDGVDQPAFRDAATAPHIVGGLRVIEVESSRPRDLFERSVDEAVVAAETLAAAAVRVGRAFRGFDVSSASRELEELARGLGTLIAIAHALSQALGVSLDALDQDGQTGSQMVAELTAHTEALIVAQQAGDWVTVADVIEYDLAPALGRWPGFLHALRRSILS